MNNLIIGAGLSGLVLAERLANVKKEQVLIIDRRNHIGGNCADIEHSEILVHQYGAHIFHTNNETVWAYLKPFSIFYPYQHRVLGLVNGEFVPIAFNLNTLKKLFPSTMAKDIESKLLARFGFGRRISILELRNYKEFKDLSDFIYEKIFLHYTVKQWQCEPENLDSNVFMRVPIIISKDNRYFPNDKFQGIPLQGYSAMFAKMIKHPLIELRLNCDYKDLDSAFVGGFTRVFYSGAIDEYFDYEYGELPYRSLYFTHLNFEKPYFQGNSVVNYPNNYDFTRIIEHKYFLDTRSPHTIISYEYPKLYSRDGLNADSTPLERYYPVPNAESSALYAEYEKKAKALNNVFFIGRLGQYRYYDMDKAIERALAVFDAL